MFVKNALRLKDTSGNIKILAKKASGNAILKLCTNNRSQRPLILKDTKKEREKKKA